MDYSNKLLKHPRGSVWKCTDLAGATKVSGVQSGYRPVLVISNDIGNYSNQAVNVLCITSQTEKEVYPINVSFSNADNETCVVLCNQIQTVSKNSLTHWMGILPVEKMQEVDEAMALALGMSRPAADLKSIENTVKKIIVAYENRILMLKKPDVTQGQVEMIAAQLEELFKDVVIPLDRGVKTAPVLTAFCNTEPVKKQTECLQVEETVVNRETTVKDVEPKEVTEETEDKPSVDTKVKTKSAVKAKNDKTKRNPRGFWTEERKQEFIKDRKDMEINDLLKKYNIANIKTAYQLAYQFERNLR